LISVLTHDCSGTVSVGLITIHPEAQSLHKTDIYKNDVSQMGVTSAQISS